MYAEYEGLTPYERAFKTPSAAMKVPFGAAVEYLPHGPDARARGKWDTVTAPALFMGWAMKPGMEWTGDYLVVPLSEISGLVCGNAPSPDIDEFGHAKLHARRIKAINIPPGPWKFPCHEASQKRRYELGSTPSHAADEDAVDGGGGGGGKPPRLHQDHQHLRGQCRAVP